MSKTVNDLVSHITELSNEDFNSLFSKLLDMQGVLGHLDKITPEERIKTLSRLELFAERSSKSFNYDPARPKDFLPKLSRLDVVDCYFTGMGFEWDEKHKAIIWDIYPQFDSVMVIPTTSKERVESKGVFNVGKIQGLNGLNTTLLVGDMTRVSRKRIEVIPPYNHPKNGPQAVKLNKAWEGRILNAIVSLYANTLTLEDVLRYRTGVAMPDKLDAIKSKRFNAIQYKYDEGSCTLNYWGWNKHEQEGETLTLIQPKVSISKFEKQRIIEDICSKLEPVRIQAEARYFNWYHGGKA
ncbi:hypothetical protein [Saccharibacillus deserti]|uniref:hypothetical protein n=1 Tax=Saccharibacillus deserti TaxID=1634444 RepID=UPI0015555844|nr:hypothetical protein [Saccharibacillus deserti]